MQKKSFLLELFKYKIRFEHEKKIQKKDLEKNRNYVHGVAKKIMVCS